MPRIRKDLPIPQKSKYAYLCDLEVGDCVEFEDFTEFQRTKDAMRYFGINHTTRSKGEIFRIWRVA
jgi:myosin heavy subunit